MGTGRSDYPNQINNVLCFPFIFRGALDARASRINDAMKIAAVEAIRGLAREPVPAEVLTAAGVGELAFGKDYVIPKPMDARLLPRVARAVALAAVASGGPHRPAGGLHAGLSQGKRAKIEGPMSGAPFHYGKLVGRLLGLGSNLDGRRLGGAALWCFFTTLVWVAWERQPWSGWQPW